VQRGTFLETDTSAVKSDKVLKNKIRAQNVMIQFCQRLDIE